MKKIRIKKVSIFLLLLLAYGMAAAQDFSIERVEPPFWWAGMKTETLQLMVYGPNIGTSEVALKGKGAEVLTVHEAENPNYLFIDLKIADGQKAGSFDLLFTAKGKRTQKYTYQLLERSGLQVDPVTSADVVYLITPDRFVNGDPANDQVDGLKEGKNRGFHSGRHGGDLAGILSKLAYLEDLGVTTLWLNPVLENDMPEYSYHGYAITDYYQVDSRYGSNETYRQLSQELEKRGMKLVNDMVFNHCGLEHWWLKDLPFNDWIHHYPEYVNTNHAISAWSDPYAAESDLSQMEQGWFVSAMPDLNHSNVFMANYLIQNSIWWIEYAGLDGIRMDTWPYNNPRMMQQWAQRVEQEYPGFFIVGETWVTNEAQEAWWAPDARLSDFTSGMSSITDFPLCFAMHKAFKEGGDVKEVYDVLSKDFLYPRPLDNLIFADNHDMDRFYHTIGNDLASFKLAMTYLLTTRGIPQLYYGTEILMEKYGEHGVLRQDFPGGWPDDPINAFQKEGRVPEQQEAFNHLRTLLNWRNGNEAIASGTLKHFIPYDNVYVYGRTAGESSVVVLMNNSLKEVSLETERYRELLGRHESGLDVFSGEAVSLQEPIVLPPKSSRVLEMNDLNTINLK